MQNLATIQSVLSKYINPLLITGLIIIWVSHLLQVFVPETGFDALWYHLPVIAAVVEQKSLVYLPELYQSLNPLFADLIFGIGFFFLEDLGTKIVAYFFGILFLCVSFFLARTFLSKTWTLLFLLVISTFQVVSWQTSSFYVDLAKAFFELLSVYFLLRYFEQDKQKDLLVSALGLGASLGTKLFSLFLLPFFIFVIVFRTKEKIKYSIVFLLTSLVIPVPFYYFAYQHTGNPFYSFFVHIDKLGEIGGQSNILSYVFERTILLPTSLFDLFLLRDYVSFIFLLFFPIIVVHYKKLFKNNVLPLTLFSLFQYFLWWYLPPLSSRYALSGFVTLALVYCIILADFSKKNAHYYLPIILSILLSVAINFAPRIIVNYRSLKYLMGQQTKHEYLEQFYDGSIDENIKKWHFTTTS